jgi:UDP-2,4-diacetamido-2,4,6-trideoxy-beta-L-altropyranose hydrolase
MAELMAQADLAIGAGGTMAWERCWMLLPSLVTVIADNQSKQVACLQKLGIGQAVETSSFESSLRQQITELIQTPNKLIKMSTMAQKLVKTRQSQSWKTVFENV